MNLPRPDDLGRAPVWDLYVAGQAVRASLGLIPRSAVAFGVEVAAYEVTLRLQLRELTENDADDIANIVFELEALLGDNQFRVDVVHEVRREPLIAPDDGVWWLYLARD